MKKLVDRDAEDLVFTEPGEAIEPTQIVLPSGDVVTYEQFKMLTAPTADIEDAPADE